MPTTPWFGKIGVEGTGIEAISGARSTIERCHPIVLVEFLKSDRLARLSVRVYWMRARELLMR
jgi:hypothetical protein